MPNRLDRFSELFGLKKLYFIHSGERCGMLQQLWWKVIIEVTQYHFSYMKTPATMSGTSLIRFLKHFVHNKRSVLLDDHWSMIQGLRELDQWIHTIPFFVLLNSASISGFSFKLTRELLCNIWIMNCSCDFEEEHPGTNSSWETLSQNGKKSVINILF